MSIWLTICLAWPGLISGTVIIAIKTCSKFLNPKTSNGSKGRTQAEMNMRTKTVTFRQPKRVHKNRIL